MRFQSDKAAWIAMMLLNHLKNSAITRVQPQPDGSVLFRKFGAWMTLHMDDNGNMDVVQVPVIKPVLTPDPRAEADIGTNAAQFDASGNNWNHRNDQHHASDPNGYVRRNAFGDVCHKPMVEGYDESDFHATMARMQARAQAQAVVQAQGTKSLMVSAEARRLCNARRAFRSGRVG